MLNGHVLLRIGGGWDTLEHYLMTHLPKAGKLTIFRLKNCLPHVIYTGSFAIHQVNNVSVIIHQVNNVSVKFQASIFAKKIFNNYVFEFSRWNFHLWNEKRISWILAWFELSWLPRERRHLLAYESHVYIPE